MALVKWVAVREGGRVLGEFLISYHLKNLSIFMFCKGSIELERLRIKEKG